ADFQVAEARWAGAVPGAHHLLGLSLSTVGRAPQGPVLRACYGRAGIPELRRNAAVTGVFEHADAFPIPDLPANFAAELKVVAFVVDRPALIRLHVNRAIGAAEYFVNGLP